MRYVFAEIALFLPCIIVIFQRVQGCPKLIDNERYRLVQTARDQDNCYFGFGSTIGEHTYMDALMTCTNLVFTNPARDHRATMLSDVASTDLLYKLLPEHDHFFYGLVTDGSKKDRLYRMDGSTLYPHGAIHLCTGHDSDSGKQGGVLIHRLDRSDNLCYEITNVHLKHSDPIAFMCIVAANTREPPTISNGVCPSNYSTPPVYPAYGDSCYYVPDKLSRNLSFIEGIDPIDNYRVPFMFASPRYAALLLSIIESLNISGPIATGLVTFNTHGDCTSQWLSGNPLKEAGLTSFVRIETRGACFAVDRYETENDTHHELRLRVFAVHCEETPINHLYYYIRGSSYVRTVKEWFVDNIDEHELCTNVTKKAVNHSKLATSIGVTTACVVCTLIAVMFLICRNMRRTSRVKQSSAHWYVDMTPVLPLSEIDLDDPAIVRQQLKQRQLCKPSRYVDMTPVLPLSEIDLDDPAIVRQQLKQRQLCKPSRYVDMTPVLPLSEIDLDDPAIVRQQLKQRQLCKPSSDLDTITRECELGGGAFGTVWKARDLNGLQFALKSVNERRGDTQIYQEQLAIEGLVMSTLYHENIVSLKAVYCSTVDNAKPSIAMEFLSGGCLYDYLRDAAVDPMLCVWKIAMDVCSGLVYLASENFVHRDIAARNVLLTSRDVCTLTAKISDFGMTRYTGSRDYYSMTSQQRLPVKWIAPEVFVGFRFTCKSDVWSFGILLYECFTRAETPYPGMEPHDVIPYVIAGGYPARPRVCTDAWYAMMRLCWQAANGRPNANDLITQIQCQRNYCVDVVGGGDEYADVVIQSG